MKKEYTWGRQIEFKKNDLSAEDVHKELQNIDFQYGALTPDNIIKSAIDPESILHGCFEWDDKKAAHNYRLTQARKLINGIDVKIINDEGVKTFPVYECVRVDNNNVFKDVTQMDRNEIEQVRKATLSDLIRIKKKLVIYTAFDRVIGLVEESISELERHGKEE